MAEQLNEMAFGFAGSILSAIVMLILGVLGNIGLYMGAVQMMQQWHILFSLSIIGIILGMIEAAIIGFILCYGFAWLYNKLIQKGR